METILQLLRTLATLTKLQNVYCAILCPHLQCIFGNIIIPTKSAECTDTTQRALSLQCDEGGRALLPSGRNSLADQKKLDRSFTGVNRNHQDLKNEHNTKSQPTRRLNIKDHNIAY